jgi:hypothetical protein
MLARVQGVEVGDAIDAEHDGLAVDDEPLASVLQRGLSEPRGRMPAISRNCLATSASHDAAYAGGFSVTNDGNMC